MYYLLFFDCTGIACTGVNYAIGTHITYRPCDFDAAKKKKKNALYCTWCELALKLEEERTADSPVCKGPKSLSAYALFENNN